MTITMTSGRPLRRSTTMTPMLSYCTGILDAARSHLDKPNAQSDQDDNSIDRSSNVQQPICTCSKICDHVRNDIVRGRPHWRGEDCHDRLSTPMAHRMWDVDSLKTSLLDVEHKETNGTEVGNDWHHRGVAEDKSPATESDNHRASSLSRDEKYICIQCLGHERRDAVEEKNHSYCCCKCAEKVYGSDGTYDPVDTGDSNAESWETQSTDNASTDTETTTDDGSDTDDSFVEPDEDSWDSEGSWDPTGEELFLDMI